MPFLSSADRVARTAFSLAGREHPPHASWAEEHTPRLWASNSLGSATASRAYFQNGVAGICPATCLAVSSWTAGRIPSSICCRASRPCLLSNAIASLRAMSLTSTSSAGFMAYLCHSRPSADFRTPFHLGGRSWSWVGLFCGHVVVFDPCLFAAAPIGSFAVRRILFRRLLIIDGGVF